MKFPGTDPGSHSWLRSANCDGGYGIALAAAVVLLLALSAGGSALEMLMRYERAGLARGEVWRLLGAHLVHLGAGHALLNCAGLVLLWVLFAREFEPRRWLWILCCSAASIDAGLWFLRPAVEWYAGASGVLHGALAAAAMSWYRRGDGLGAALVLLLVVKLVYEQQSGLSVFERDLPLLPDAHLFGALGGLLAAWLPRPMTKPL
jgi:rhomboid family GlyGly-CTERM serine protease